MTLYERDVLEKFETFYYKFISQERVQAKISKYLKETAKRGEIEEASKRFVRDECFEERLMRKITNQ